MEIFTNIILLIAGFIMLVKGADWFVDSAANLAKKIHIPELVIGLTLVAFGTSAPELSVSLTSALKTASNGITIGNVVGSNIMNIVLILGLTSVLCKIPCQRNSLILDIPYMLMATVLFIILGCIGNQYSKIDGMILVGLLIVYIAILVIISIKQKTNLFSEEGEETDSTMSQTGLRGFIKSISDKAWFLILLLLTGLACVVYGSDLVVKSATNIAKYFGVSDRIIGLTMIALGTSLPELVTSITAARKGKTDIAIGNIIGSNIFNILCVAGVTACFVPVSFRGFFMDSIEALISALLLALLCYLPGHTIKRWGGFVMLAFYIAFMAKTFMTI